MLTTVTFKLLKQVVSYMSSLWFDMMLYVRTISFQENLTWQ